MKIRGSSILVTGGANGLGYGIVERLIEEGALVSILDKDQKALERLSINHPEIIAMCCDLTKFEAVTQAISEILQQVKVIHGLINNAGIIKNAPLVNLFSKEKKIDVIKMWDEVLANNLTSAFYVTTLIAENMISSRTKGVIINIASISAHGNAGQTAYSAAKAGLIGMSKTWAKELGPLGIRCVAISPGFINTPSTQLSLTENTIDHIVKSTPMRKLGCIHDITNAVVFAFENNFYTGKTLEIDGGLVF